MKSPNPLRALPSIEILEARIAPATISIVGGVATYTAAPGETNTINFRIETNGFYQLSGGPNITLGSGAAGIVSGTMPGTVVFHPNDVVGIVFNLGDMNDLLNVQGLADPLTVNGEGGDDRFTTNSFSGAITLSANGGPIYVETESVSLSASSPTPITNATSVTFKTNNFETAGTITATSISILSATAGREYDLGTENASRISITAAEASKLVAGTIRIGDATSGAIFSDDALNFGSATLLLTAGGNTGITQSGAGAMTTALLGIQSSGSVTMNGANNVARLAANLTGSGASLAFTDANGFQIGDVGGISGLITASTGSVTLNAGNVQQTVDARIQTNSLVLQGAGPFLLENATNDVAGISANIFGSLAYTDATALATFGPVATGGGSISLVADSMNLAHSINAGTANVTLAPLTSSTAINLGGADAANVLGLTDAELGFITASTLRIGVPEGVVAENPLTVSAAIAPAGVSTLELNVATATASGAGAITVPSLSLLTQGAITLGGANDVDTLIFASGTVTGNSTFADADGFTLGHPFNVAGTQIVTFDVGTATVSLPGSMYFIASIEGATVGTGYDQVVVNGTVNIAGSTLSINSGPSVPAGREFVIIANDGTDAVTGTFDGLDEGDTIPGFSPAATITYQGGDGNDVAIITADPLVPGVGAKGKSLFFTDVDGDEVTITASKGTFTGSEISGVQIGANGESRFEKLTLGAGFAGANITITAKPGQFGGNGFVNLGFLDATGVDLGAVSIAGDLARLAAGTVGGDAKVPALKSLAVQSIGLLGNSTLAVADQNFVGIQLQGALPKLTIKDDLRGVFEINGATDGKLGTATIGGSIVGSGVNFAEAGIGLLKVVGDIRAVGGVLNIRTDGQLGGVTVDGGIVGQSNGGLITIAGFGQLIAPTKGVDLAIGAIIVKGSAEHLTIAAGSTGSLNADASIGAITVGGDWIAGSVVAGIGAGFDSHIGTDDDGLFAGRDNANIKSTIGSFTIKGQAFGTATATDMFGVVAEQIGKAKVGTRTYAFTKTGSEAFFAAPTVGGAGAGNPAFDFIIRELGSTTPAVAIGGSNLIISTNQKTATFTDVDGDLVTVKRSAGEFVIGDFTLVSGPGGGGLLSSLVVAPTFDGKAFNLSITAKVGPGGGNGFVNVGKIDADDVDLGNVVIGGELQDLDVGDINATKPGLASLTVHSLGAVGGTSPNGDEINSAHGIGKITVKTDVRNFHIFANRSNTGNLGSLTVGGSMHTSEVQAAADIGTIKIGGSFLGTERIQANNRIGTITVGGDFAGGGTIEAFAISSNTAKGSDIALKSFTVGGSVEKTTIILGRNNNTDASIGTISVGRAWLASSVLSGVEAGGDTLIGTSDDRKVTQGGPTDEPTRFSTIASILIKGQALGTAAAGDSFGIVAEQIGKAQIGTRKFVFDKGERDAADAFAAAPTGDFFIREATL